MPESHPLPRIALAYVRRESAADSRYIQALERAGAVPVPLWSDETGWERLLGEADGLLLTGGGDIDPALYGLENGRHRCEGVDRSRDERERAALALARQRGLPVLGICRGMQLLNVLFTDGDGRGVLSEDLPQTPVRHRAQLSGASSFHMVEVKPGTRLAAILGGAGSFPVNSRHHQGMRSEQIARGLVVSAVAPDGVVEAVEAPGEPFLLAVQCHPEREGEASEFAAVISGLIHAAKAALAKR